MLLVPVALDLGITVEKSNIHFPGAVLGLFASVIAAKRKVAGYYDGSIFYADAIN